MKKFFAYMMLAFSMLVLLAPIALAEEAPAAAAAAPAGDAKMGYYTMAVLACGLAIGIAAFGTGLGQGLSIGKACDGVARNPGASGKITTTLIIGLAMIESLAIYALVVVLIVFFVNPFKI